MSGKVLRVADDLVEIGEAGELVEVRRADLTFEPRVGDVVDVFRSDSGVRVVLAEAPKAVVGGGAVSEFRQSGEGININLNQSQGHPMPLAGMPPFVVPLMAPGVAYGKVVNKTTYVILALLLGGVGVHKFYEGKAGLGILYLLFCWTFIPAIVALLEAIVVGSKPSDAYGNVAL